MPVVSKTKNKNENNVEDDDESLSTSNFVPLKEAKKKKKIDFPYNNKTVESYTKNGLKAPDNLDMQERLFLSRVSVDEKAEHNIRKEITKICRIKAIDYSSKKLERKEFIYFYENWHGVNWRGTKIPSVTDHVSGIYYEQELEPKIGEQPDEIVGYKRTGQHKVYYIPFSKEKVDEIIESSVGTDKETIKFLFSQEPLGFEYNYNEFVNLPYEELSAMLIAAGGPRAVLMKQQQEELQKQKQIATTTNKQKQ